MVQLTVEDGQRGVKIGTTALREPRVEALGICQHGDIAYLTFFATDRQKNPAPQRRPVRQVALFQIENMSVIPPRLRAGQQPAVERRGPREQRIKPE